MERMADYSKVQAQFLNRTLRPYHNPLRLGHTWAIHWLEPKLRLFNVKVEHILLVVFCMARRAPQVEVEDVGRDHLLIFILPVLFPNVLHLRQHNFTSVSVNGSRLQRYLTCRTEVLCSSVGCNSKAGLRECCLRGLPTVLPLV